MKKTTTILLAMLLVGALALSACQQAPATTEAPAPTTAPDQPPPDPPTEPPPDTPSQQPTTPPTQPPDQPETPPDAPVTFSDVTTGLDTLSSYRADFTFSFDGIEDGAPIQQTMTWFQEFTQNPPAQHLEFTSPVSGVGDGGLFSLYTIEGQNYIITGETCIVTPADEDLGSSLAFTPNDFLGGFGSETFLGIEQVNGVTASHYSANPPATAFFGGLTAANVEFWVAEGGYMVKLIMQATGSSGGFFGATGSDTNGTVTMEYNVRDVNQPITIVVPDGCAGGAPDDVPVMLDAANLSSFGSLITYTSASPFDVVEDFYRTQMAANGWTLSPAETAVEGLLILSYTKDSRSLSLTVTSGTETTVLISISE